MRPVGRDFRNASLRMMVRRAPDAAVSKVTAQINRRQEAAARYTPDYPSVEDSWLTRGNVALECFKHFQVNMF